MKLLWVSPDPYIKYKAINIIKYNTVSPTVFTALYCMNLSLIFDIVHLIIKSMINSHNLNDENLKSLSIITLYKFIIQFFLYVYNCINNLHYCWDVYLLLRQQNKLRNVFNFDILLI